METEILHRIQFAFTITFHYIYPPLSIGLSLLLVLYEWLYIKTQSPLWEKITQFWIRVFALTFALGIATGIPLMFSFGTNWSRYSKFIGDVLGSALAAEGVFAFGIEAGFLGIVLFGWGRVSQKMHFLATCMVAIGAHFSGFWIVTVNSWMHTPAGYAIIRNQKGVESAIVTDWLQMIFNPSNIPHQIHVILGAWLSGALLVVSVSAYYLLKNKWTEFAISSIKVAGALTLFSALFQLAAADHLGKVIARENPTKMAAFEGVFTTEEYSKAYLFGIVDTKEKKVHGLAIPGLLSFLIHNNFKTAVQGLDKTPEDQWPNVQAVFQVYHIMIATWVLIFLSSLVIAYMWYTKRWVLHRYFMWFLIASVSFPQIGNITGWYSSCMGRQPWTVHKLLKTKDAYSPRVTFQQALISLTLFIFIYLLMFVLFLFLLDKKIKHGPTSLPEDSPYRDPFKLE